MCGDDEVDTLDLAISNCDGLNLSAEVVKTFPHLDLAVCEADVGGANLESIDFATDILDEGQRVFYGGFPLDHPRCVLEVGRVNSVFDHQSIDFYTISGAVLKGESGSPMFALHKGQLVLAGVLNFQMAQIAEKHRVLADIFHLGGWVLCR